MKKTEYGNYIFGFWEGMIYKPSGDKYEDFEQFRNEIEKEKVIQYIESLPPAYACAYSKDLFTGEIFNAGIYEDGEFIFPIDFLRYYKRKDIGIPYEYEEYLKEILK